MKSKISEVLKKAEKENKAIRRAKIEKFNQNDPEGHLREKDSTES